MLNVTTSSSLLLAFVHLHSNGVLPIYCIRSHVGIVVSYVVLVALYVCWYNNVEFLVDMSTKASKDLNTRI